MIKISRINNKKDIKECCMYVEKDYPHPYESLCYNCPGKDSCEKSTSKMLQKEGYIAMRYCCEVENWDKWHKKEEEKTEALENAMLALGHDLDRMAWDMSCE